MADAAKRHTRFATYARLSGRHFVAWLLRRTVTKLVTVALAYASYVVAPI